MARGSKTGCAIANTVTDRKSKAKESKRMKQIFRGKSFSFSGDFGENWGHEKMAGWIKPHGGRYEREVSDDTTHLICTVEHFKQKTKQGRSLFKHPINILLIML
jgi:NAD-dependent DNA ligase